MIDLQWDDLRCLEAIERMGKVAAAARDLGVSPSTLYRRVAAVEAQVGEPCLVRGADTLTEVGAMLARVGVKTRASMAEVNSFITDRETCVVGEVTLTTVPALLPFLEAPLLALSTAHPQLQVTLHLGYDGPSVRDREVDVALAITPRPPAGCWGRRLARLDAGVFGSASAVAATPRRFVARSLDEKTSPESAWERAHAKNVAVRAPFHALVELCAAGVGLGLMPRLIAAQHPSLVEVPEYAATTTRLDRVVWLLTHPDRRHTPRIATLMAALSTCMPSSEAAVTPAKAKPKKNR